MTVKITDAKDFVRTSENVVQDAVNQTEFGWFNLKIFAITALICLNGGAGFGNISLILPSVACDFQLSTIDKGRIGIMPILGMVFGPYCWATVAEMKGRRTGLIGALVIHAIGDFAASLVSNYYGLLVCKFIVGVGCSGQIALLFTYLGEFQPCRFRDRLLSWLEMSWALGLITVAGLGWAILPLSINYHSETTSFIFTSWSLYLLICSLLPPILALWLLFLPETPKYLAETGQHDKLLDLLSDMYHTNTRRPRQEYLERIMTLGNLGINDFIAKAQERAPPKRKTVRQMISQYVQQTKEIVKPPHLRTTVLMAICSYSITASYFTMIFWLPEIFQRYSVFEEQFPSEPASICKISSVLYATNATQKLEVDYSNCTNVLNDSVYFHNVILGATCIPAALWLPLCIDRLGYKVHYVGASLISAGLAFGLFFVETSTQNLIVACLFEALASISITILLCMLVELYPTHLRVIASAFSSFVGRCGAFVGISLVGYLIDDHCLPLILLIGVHLVVGGIVGIFIPIHKSKEEYEKREQLEKQSTEEGVLRAES